MFSFTTSWTPNAARPGSTCSADASVALTGKRDWDLAEADIILSEAGGRLTDTRGQTLVYNKPSAKQSSLIAANPALSNEVIALLDGRDLTARLIEARTQESFVNRTASEIAELLALIDSLAPGLYEMQIARDATDNSWQVELVERSMEDIRARSGDATNEAFPEVAVRRRWFVAWNLLNWKGRAQAAARIGLSKLGAWGSGHNLVFSARKR